ncbi:endonuclease domain-containing protein [Streptomyces pseudogriseolus]|uniref:endonuclease domain-containing protein n=1 Tax=Streptomyces pseudogriseolus TaxID=36817 RepID=UPI003FA2323D
MDWDFSDDDLFVCDWCGDDDTPDPRARRRHKILCIRCDKAARQVHRYRITVPRMNAIMRFQGDACALCQESPSTDPSPDAPSFWHIDHDHRCCPPGGSCGHCVRGLLCLPAYERLPNILRDSPRFNAYLDNPPAGQPAACPTNRDHTGPRDASSYILDAFFASRDSSRGSKRITDTATPPQRPR